MNVRQTQLRDLPAILAITNREIREGYAHFGIEQLTPQSLQADFEAAADRYPWFSAVDGDTLLGFAKAYAWKPRGAYATTVEVGVYVIPQAQGRGVGKALYSQLFPALQGMRFRTLVAGIALPNPGSIRLHESFGMVHVGTLPNMGYKLGAWRSVGYWHKFFPD